MGRRLSYSERKMRDDMEAVDEEDQMSVSSEE